LWVSPENTRGSKYAGHHTGHHDTSHDSADMPSTSVKDSTKTPMVRKLPLGSGGSLLSVVYSIT
jgi:hypothetical protein